MADAANTGEQIDKAERIVWMRGGRTRQQILQITKLAVAHALPGPVAYQQSFEYCRAPVTLAMGQQLVGTGFNIIDIQQLPQ